MSADHQHQINSQARARAQASVEGLAMQATGRVEYRSHGHVVIIGGPEALEFAPRLQARHKTTIVLLHGAELPATTVIPVGGRALQLEGYLGNFHISLGEVGRANHETVQADIVLDMSDKPLLAMPLLPPGYFFTPTDEHSLSQVQTLLDELIGTFEKPRYFDYDASICAHARSGQSGCNNCIDACPAEAIHSLAESIEVNPYLCQGGGICASACPTGAIRYCYPSVSDTLDRIRKLLQVYYQQGGQDAVVTFVAESDVEKLSAIPSNLLPVVVEEVASLGLDIWLAALAYGARRILLITTGEMPDRVQHSLMLQLQTAAEILCGLGHCETAIQMVSSEDLHRACHAAMPVLPPATFAAFNDKRRMMFMALDHLYVSSAAPEGIIPLSTGAPFGAVQVSNQACTLCLGCTSVCPTHALFAGNDEPKLLFNEIQCVQCGICASACPENAITLTPRLLADPDLRQRHVTLHREDALCCVNCGKPFATKSVVNNMLAKLEGHWMFQNERARRRLLMCDDCRVMDVVQDPEAMQQGFVERQRH